MVLAYMRFDSATYTQKAVSTASDGQKLARVSAAGRTTAAPRVAPRKGGAMDSRGVALMTMEHSLRAAPRACRVPAHRDERVGPRDESAPPM